MFKDFFMLVLKSIQHRRMRSWLTVLGIVIGIMLVVTIFALGSGIKNVVSQSLQMFGSDLIVIFPGETTNPFASMMAGQKFKDRDIDALTRLPGVKLVAPVDTASLNGEFRGEKKAMSVRGVRWRDIRPIFQESQGVKLESGAWPTNEDANEAVLGYLVAHELFKNPIRVGDELIVKSKRVAVAGIVSRTGAQDDDNSTYLGMAPFRHLTGREGAVSVMVKAAPDANVELVAREIKFELDKQEAVPEFSVLTMAKANELIGGVLSVVELGLIAIALISLIVGAVGIMNTMYTSVLERTKQIGVMKAVGASRNHILALFLLESGMIGLVGGIFGVIFGIGIAYAVGAVAGKMGMSGLFSFAAVDYLGLLVILLITFTTGILAGVLPARQAASMQPAEALRYE
ncbi:MAG: ABC transporter permease [Candidatus Jorgensenbacteria bacterium]